MNAPPTLDEAAQTLAQSYRVDAAVHGHSPIEYFDRTIRMFCPSLLAKDRLARRTRELLANWDATATPAMFEEERRKVAAAKESTCRMFRDPEHISMLCEEDEETFREAEAVRLGVPLSSVTISERLKQEIRQRVEQRIEVACRRIAEGGESRAQ